MTKTYVSAQPSASACVARERAGSSQTMWKMTVMELWWLLKGSINTRTWSNLLSLLFFYLFHHSNRNGADKLHHNQINMARRMYQTRQLVFFLKFCSFCLFLFWQFLFEPNTNGIGSASLFKQIVISICFSNAKIVIPLANDAKWWGLRILSNEIFGGLTAMC